MKFLTFAIKFDEVLTAEPGLWRVFIGDAMVKGHKVVCFTARRETKENRKFVREYFEAYDIQIPVYFTSLGSKVEYANRIGLKVDVWIDDDPEECALGH